MKGFFNVILERRSVRDFKTRDVPLKYINKIVASASLAPSGGNQKNWSFIIVKDKTEKGVLKKAVLEKIKELSDKMNSSRAKSEFLSYSKYFTFFAAAPVVVAVVVKPYDSITARILKRYEGDVDYVNSAGIQSVAAAIENMLLATAALGLGACWMTGPLLAKEQLEKILDITPPDNLLALVPIGYPRKRIKPHSWPKSIDSIVRIQ